MKLTVNGGPHPDRDPDPVGDSHVGRRRETQGGTVRIVLVAETIPVWTVALVDDGLCCDDDVRDPDTDADTGQEAQDEPDRLQASIREEFWK